MTPAALLRETAEKFRAVSIPDPETDGALLLSSLCGKPPLSLRLDTETVLEPAVLESFHLLVNRRCTREPLQYILQEAFFCGRAFHVDSRVLIPRPETELLCRWALEVLPDTADILDLCCGSGCIGLTISLEKPSACVTLSDVSSDALSVAGINKERLGAKAFLHCCDLTEDFSPSSFDCIISNPPYIPTEECALLQEEVLCEPRIALDGGNDGLQFYRRIAEESSRVLRNGGQVFLEVGTGESESVASIFLSHGFSRITVRNDFRGIPRMVHAVCGRPEDICLKS